MCFHKPHPIPKHLLLAPEPSIYRRPASLWRQAFALLLLSVMLTGVSTLRAYPLDLLLPEHLSLQLKVKHVTNEEDYADEIAEHIETKAGADGLGL